MPIPTGLNKAALARFGELFTLDAAGGDPQSVEGIFERPRDDRQQSAAPVNQPALFVDVITADLAAITADPKGAVVNRGGQEYRVLGRYDDDGGMTRLALR